METARVSRSGSGKTTLTGKVTTNVGGDTEARHPSRKRRHSANVAVESGVHDVDNAVTFGEIEAAMGNLGWSWIPVGIAYIYVAPHAFRQCTAKTFRTFKEGVDYIYTQERFEAYVRDDAALLEKVRLNLQNAKKKSPHLSAEPLCAIKGDVGSPLLHRESAWHRLKRFVDIGLRSEKTRTLVLHGCDGSGKTSLLRQLKAYAIQMYDNQMATVPDRPVEDGGSGFPSPPPHYKRKLHVVHASTTPRNHMAPVKKPTTTSLNGDGHTAEYLSSDGLFIDVVAAFQVEFGDVCRYDSWTTPARAVWDQVLDSYHVVQTNTSPVYIGRIIFLFVDGLNVYYHDRNILRDLFKAVHAKHNNVVHMIVTTAGPPASLLTVLKSLDLHHRNTVVALPSLNSAALTEILMDRLGPPAVDGVAIREDAVAFVGRLVELVGAGSVSIALAVCRRTLLQKYDALTPTYLAQGNNHSVKCDVVQVGDMVTSAKELFGGDVVTARWVLAALPRVPQVNYSLHDHLVRSSYDLFRRELDWMVANDLASWNGDVFTLFIPQDEAMSFFHGNLWKNDMCLQSTSKKHNTVRV
ncbi:hypothetical protein DYB38_006433 [Aphanomyces astaci]|uniref:Uncharacterized protein n=1 Tax=Aphanomyces astaci TaxID=112090 RepID=A0A397D3W9_APHAT|nr:hypothetical protein DYB38_006433 [Aphanomyces astaci]